MIILGVHSGQISIYRELLYSPLSNQEIWLRRHQNNLRLSDATRLLSNGYHHSLSIRTNNHCLYPR